ncbi:MAG TPA: N-acyl homoserine lactonase family protein [Thermomicrobiales bacterium]|nr:N-acyl homoserine lactonase family protein [Thermomicrobiales bacterium]
MTTHTLYLLPLGQLGRADPTTGAIRFNQVPGYLIRSAAGRLILIDTGNPAALVGAADARPWFPALQNATTAEDDVVRRLAELAITPAQIDVLVSTHFDFDHCGRHDVFAALGTMSLVQQAHLAAACAQPQRYDPTLWDRPGLRYEAIDGDRELEPGLRLLATPGHAVGHQSVFVETDAGPVVLAIDAIPNAQALTTDPATADAADVATFARSRDRLAALAAETGAYLLFGHDAAQWATLPKSPTPFRRP